jgi:hypothetical protein
MYILQCRSKIRYTRCWSWLSGKSLCHEHPPPYSYSTWHHQAIHQLSTSSPIGSCFKPQTSAQAVACASSSMLIMWQKRKQNTRRHVDDLGNGMCWQKTWDRTHIQGMKTQKKEKRWKQEWNVAKKLIKLNTSLKTCFHVYDWFVGRENHFGSLRGQRSSRVWEEISISNIFFSISCVFRVFSTIKTQKTLCKGKIR